jgi:hypothetical protein
MTELVRLSFDVARATLLGLFVSANLFACSDGGSSASGVGADLAVAGAAGTSGTGGTGGSSAAGTLGADGGVDVLEPTAGTGGLDGGCGACDYVASVCIGGFTDAMSDECELELGQMPDGELLQADWADYTEVVLSSPDSQPPTERRSICLADGECGDGAEWFVVGNDLSAPRIGLCPTACEIAQQPGYEVAGYIGVCDPSCE